MLIHYYLATQVSQATVELTGRHLLLMPKVTLNSPGRPGSVYVVNVSTISLCKLLLYEYYCPSNLDDDDGVWLAQRLQQLLCTSS